MNNTASLGRWWIAVLSLLITESAIGSELRAAVNDIHLESAGTEVDAVTKQIRLPKVRIWQAGYEIQADLAEAKGLNFDDSQWNFTGKVRITTPQGSANADRAVVKFVQNRITEFHIVGQPATFEQHSSTLQLQAQGRAEVIDYLLESNSVRLSTRAWIKYGENEFSGQSVVYDMTNQRILANPDEQQGQRVHITISPNRPPSSEVTPDSGIKTR